MVVGALGQIGTELVEALVEKYGSENILATDIRHPSQVLECSFEILDATDSSRIDDLIANYDVEVVYHLAATLSAKAESNPLGSWDLNMKSLMIFLELGREKRIKKFFWPSSIAVFGPSTPKNNTPQRTVSEPNTVYGISKLAGERWCEYYSEKYDVDVRSLRYPGLIGYKSLPGGGTTDYAVDIFHKAVSGEEFNCFLKEDCMLPMMYMKDAIRGTLQLMDADSSSIRIRSSYNFSGISFTPSQLADEIKKIIPGFTINYQPDSRQQIADSWPSSIYDEEARSHWGWKREYDIETMCKEMIFQLSQKVES